MAWSAKAAMHVELFNAECVCVCVPERYQHTGNGVGGTKWQHQCRAGMLTPVPHRSSVESSAGCRSRKACPTSVSSTGIVASPTASDTVAGGFGYRQFDDFGGRRLDVGREPPPAWLSASASFSASSAMSRNTVAGSVPDSTRCSDVPGCLDPCLTRTGLLVEPGVVDRDAGCRGQCFDQHLVVFAEWLTVGFFGEVEIPEHLVADAHGYPEECAHRRMVRRKPDRGGVLLDVVQPDRLADRR